jgi:hypothetical protein
MIFFELDSRVPDAVQRATLLRRAGTPGRRAWAPDQQRTTPQARRAAQHPGNAVPYLVYIDAAWTAAQSELIERE